MDKKKRAIARRAISFPNKVLFGKWSWRFTLERDFLWRLVIVRKYGKSQEVGVFVKVWVCGKQ